MMGKIEVGLVAGAGFEPVTSGLKGLQDCINIRYFHFVKTCTQDQKLVILSSIWHCRQIFLDNRILIGYYAKYENG